MYGPCMCGDTQCPSCGPAQGNSRCPACRTWADDGCECSDEMIEAAGKAQAEADDAFAADIEAERNNAAIWREAIKESGRGE